MKYSMRIKTNIRTHTHTHRVKYINWRMSVIENIFAAVMFIKNGEHIHMLISIFVQKQKWTVKSINNVSEYLRATSDMWTSSKLINVTCVCSACGPYEHLFNVNSSACAGCCVFLVFFLFLVIIFAIAVAVVFSLNASHQKSKFELKNEVTSYKIFFFQTNTPNVTY